MEALRSDTVHTSDSIRSLSCIGTHHIDELSKEKEDELLYGAGDDGDEEEALSDDSMRLRLSDDDDEAEQEVVLTTILHKENKLKDETVAVMSGKNQDAQASPVPEINLIQHGATAREIREEERCAGNISMDDKVVTDHEKDNKRNKNGLMRPIMNNMPRYMWSSYDFQRRFASTPHSSVNYISYTRHCYSARRGHNRGRSYDYNKRFHNAFLPFERGRGYYNSHYKIYGSRKQKKSFKSAAMMKPNPTSEFDQNLVSFSNTDISSRSEPDTSVKHKNSTDKKNGKCNVLDSESPISSDNSNANLNELPNKDLEDTKVDDLNKVSVTGTTSVNDPLELQPKLIVAKESSETRTPSNDTKCEDITTIETNSINESYKEEIVNSMINSHDNDVETIKEDKTSTNNTNSDSDKSNNLKILEKLLTENTKCKSDNDEVVECTKKVNKNNKQGNETIKATTDSDVNESEQVKHIHKLGEQEVNESQQSIETDQRIELTETNCKIVFNNLKEKIITDTESTVNEEVTNLEIEKLLGDEKKDAPVQGITSKGENENNDLKANVTALNNLSSIEGDKEIEILQNNILLEPITNGVKCDKDQLNDSDNSTNSSKLLQVLLVSEDRLINSKINLQEHKKDTVEENVESTEKDSSAINFANDMANLTKNTASGLDENDLPSVKSQDVSLGLVIDVKDNSGDSDKKVVDVPVTVKRRKRRTKKMIAAAQEAAAEEDKQVKDSGRQKRRTAKNAEEIIRKKFLSHDSDLESSDGSDKFVIVNHKINQDARPLSPPSLKRNFTEIDSVTMNGSVKKVKVNCETTSNEVVTNENNSDNIKKLDYVHKFFRRDLKEKLPKLKQEELEELLIQKIVETITMRGEIGKLREQARISERNQEVTRAKCQQLTKQIKDFEMVLSRNAADRRANNDKPIPPIKINRSVGLQVNFITDHGMQNLRQLQQNSNMKSIHVSNSNNTPNTSNETNNATSPRRGIKVRSPRRTESVGGQTAVISQNHTQPLNIMSTITPAALVVAKPVDTQHTLTLPNQSNVQQIISNPQPQQPTQTVVLNGKFPNQINRQSTTVNVAKARANDLIDLTDEEEKSKVAASIPVVTTTITDQQINLAQKTQPCFQRVIQTIPGNVAITSQPPSIRVVQPASQPTPTALVNNMNAPRLAYVMQSGVGPTRQLLIAPNSNPMRPVTSCNRASFSTLTYKTGISTVANGTVRVLTTSAASTVQLNKHPAPLPDTRKYTVNPVWKLPPPAPSLKISKTSNGIVLSWNMNLSDKHADIASYQLYAYQEVAGIPPNTSLWKKVGDVRALPLPMACTLTQFSEGNNYYFAVRAVDTHSRKGQYSTPGNISL
ncbi:activating transcription factor 7-interacting protein 1 isoform X1 [Colletes gigas]|uniref:activating transcription factor 7-interacting protein 1 isoform X1 n=2 Tax=Colletes gigas TaxID=935657 RepID=UPI001C9BABA4|nr:activating transcription factor 7-interacting protein 1 isoform X1 [Colletes gigas]XP_043259314.1 activating transcription factor 7-interacting protein 1 isoform X1 [Colletes gigas]XP_043259323.1 activating transcription factor 7-interacting protein 1 isoform X1 [Colletes gigas]